jgi:hypothetical protein
VRLADAERASKEMQDHLTAGRDLLAKLVRITGATKPTELADAPDAREVAAAAHAFADRAKARASVQSTSLAA